MAPRKRPARVPIPETRRFFLALVLMAGTTGAASGGEGEWPVYRGHRSLAGRAMVRGHIAAPPRARWRYRVGRDAVLIDVTPDPGRADALDFTALAAPDAAAWPLPTEADAPCTTTTVYADILPDIPGDEKIEFIDAFNLPIIDGRPSYGPGRLYRMQDGQWRQLWQTPDIDLGYSPRPIVGDFDGDGEPEVGILPWNRLMIFGARTGRLKAECAFTDGRNYGFWGAYDFDRDGVSEFLVLADFAKHVDVLGFRDGELTLLWREQVELERQDPRKSLRVVPEPVGDVNGDGRDDVVINTFNPAGDELWHVTVRDGMTGRVHAELVGQIAQELCDLDGDGRAELLTVEAAGPGPCVPVRGTIHIQGWSDGGLRSLWSQRDAAWQTWLAPVNRHTQNHAADGRVGVLKRRVGARSFLAVHRTAEGRAMLELIHWTAGRAERLAAVTGDQLTALAIDDDGRWLVQAAITVNEPTAPITVENGHAQILARQATSIEPVPPLVAWAGGDERPTIIVEGDGELVAFRAPVPGGTAVTRWRLTGRGQGDGNAIHRIGPVVADLRGGGGREVVYARTRADGSAELAVVDVTTGTPIWSFPLPSIGGGPAVWNRPGLVFWTTLRLGNTGPTGLLLTFRRNIMHSNETWLLDGRDGAVLWRRDRQFTGWGCGGQPLAIADLNGDGFEDAASFYNYVRYALDGRTGRDLFAFENLWPDIQPSHVYWGQPLAVTLGAGEPSLLFATTGRSMIGRIETSGELAWSAEPGAAPNGMPAVGDFDGDGELEALFAATVQGVRCYDVRTGQVRWTIDEPRAAPAQVDAICADVDADGRDEALFSVGRTLYCVGVDAAGAGRLAWSLDFPAAISSPIFADAEGDGQASILVTGADGYVYCVR